MEKEKNRRENEIQQWRFRKLGFLQVVGEGEHVEEDQYIQRAFL